MNTLANSAGSSRQRMKIALRTATEPKETYSPYSVTMRQTVQLMPIVRLKKLCVAK